jgi:hypothetical protein
MDEKFDFANFILPSADNMAVALTDYLNYHLDTALDTTIDMATLQGLLIALIVVGVNVTTQQATK